MNQAVFQPGGMDAGRSLAAAALLLACFVSASGADALYFGVVKSALYEQTLTAAPAPLASCLYVADAIYDGSFEPKLHIRHDSG